MNVILKPMNIVHKSCLEFKLLPPFDQHYRPIIPPTEVEVRILNVPWDSCKITIRSAKVLRKKFAVFFSKDDKTVYKYFFRKLNILHNHGFPRPILSKKHPWNLKFT